MYIKTERCIYCVYTSLNCDLIRSPSHLTAIISLVIAAAASFGAYLSLNGKNYVQMPFYDRFYLVETGNWLWISYLLVIIFF